MARASALGMFLATATLIAASQVGCGKPDTPSPLGHQGDGSGQVPLKGVAGFGSQCPSGYNTDPMPVNLELWECPINVQTAELTEPLVPILFSADCNRKVLTIRTVDRSIDTNWEMLPDGSFYISLDGLKAKLKSDGAGNTDCTVPLGTDIWGKVECGPGRDQAKIKFETIMWLNRGPNPGSSASPLPSNPNNSPNTPPGPPSPPATSPSPRPSTAPRMMISPVDVPGSAATATTGPQCKIPQGKCYFHAVSQVSQCR